MNYTNFCMSYRKKKQTTQSPSLAACYARSKSCLAMWPVCILRKAQLRSD